MQSVDAATFLEAIRSGATIFDTRTRAQFERNGLMGSSLLTLDDVQAHKLPQLPKDTPIYLICERGQVSELVGLYLETASFEKVHNLAGGFVALRQLESH